MSNAIDVALTALQAFDRRNEVIANNIANVNTDGFKKSRADMTQMTLPGVTVSTQRVNTPGDTVTINGVERESSNVNVEEELMALMVNQRGYETNILVAKASQEMQGTLFDILG